MTDGQLPERVLQEELLGASVVAGSAAVAIEDPVVDIDGEQVGFVADRERAVLRIRGVARFAVDRGRHVIVERDPLAMPGMVHAYLNSTVISLLLAQRGCFALHANAVEIAGAAVLIAGASGAGKSTTAARLHQRGCRILADDLSPLDIDAEGILLRPTDRGFRLWPATAAALGIDVSGARRAVPSSEKLLLDHAPADPAPVRAVVVLAGPHDRPHVESRRVRGAQAVRLVEANGYRSELLRPVWPAELFEWAVEIVSRVPVFLLHRPDHGWSVDEVADAIEASVR